jgi:ferredoxin
MTELTPLPDLAHDAARAGPVRTRRPVYLDLLPPCNAGCPAGENIQAWLAQIQAGQAERAWRQLVADNPLPAIHGRVCYHPCETACNRAQLDSSVSIHGVERFLGDHARDAGLPGRINTVLQTCFFAISGVLPPDEAISAIKSAIAKTYGRRGPEVVVRNNAAVDQALAALHQIPVPGRVTASRGLLPLVPADAPDFVRRVDARGLPGTRYSLQVYAEDCTGCALCVEACPVRAPGEAGQRAINLAPREPLVEQARRDIAFFENLPVNDRSRVDFGTVRGTQFLQPLFEFSGACAGCGETPYLKLLSQLFGDRLMIANATGCSSIYGGNLPTTPWAANAAGRGPAWSNSLFEDNAEFGLGFRLAADLHLRLASDRLAQLREQLGGMGQQYRAVASGYWPLIRYDPELRAAGHNPFLLDSPRPRIPLADYTSRELRYRILAQRDPVEAERLMALAEHEVQQRWATYEEMATSGAARFPADGRPAAAASVSG